jgi:hypothetical protein
MSQFEDDLRAALRRRQPPADFTERVMVRTRPAPRSKTWMAAVAACLLAAIGSFEYQQYEGRKAKRELLLALQITGSKLNIAHQKVLELNRKTIHD